MELSSLYFTLFNIEILRYAIGGGIFYLALVLVVSRYIPHTRISTKDLPGRKIIFEEIFWSSSTAVIYALAGTVLIGAMLPQGYTRIYFNIDAYGYIYYVFSILICLLLHDAFFALSHRLLHIPWLYKHVHCIHHRFKNPTAFASWAFHPVEALVTFIAAALPFFIIPVHWTAAIIYIVIIQLYNLIGHSGVEIMPREFISNRFMKYHNTPTHHNMHHHFPNYHFSLYLNVWDRIMKTHHHNYETEFLKHTPTRYLFENHSISQHPRRTTTPNNSLIVSGQGRLLERH